MRSALNWTVPDLDEGANDGLHPLRRRILPRSMKLIPIYSCGSEPAPALAGYARRGDLSELREWLRNGDAAESARVAGMDS
jgi:hypothetical protein